MYLLKGNIHSYEWGSRTLIAQITGRPSPTRKPEAEAWFGAHSGGPSQILGADANDLQSFIAHDRSGQLGPDHRELPFLLKLLAARKALSIQAHPSKEEAEAGFTAENAAGLGTEAPERNYKDANHKPELLVAISEFHALAGFRPLADTIAMLRILNIPAINDELNRLVAAEGDVLKEKDALRHVLEEWLTAPEGKAEQIVTAVVRRCDEVAAGAEKDAAAGDVHPDCLADVVRTVGQLAEDYPGDPGILVALLLNRVTLQPGEAIFLAAGQLHAYLDGLGVEVMANSDNVLRGGLTSKHIDVPELLNILDATPLADPRCPQDGGRYRTSVSDFSMTVLAPGESRTVTGPAVVLAAGGELTVTSEDGELTVPSGFACWVGYSDGEATVTTTEESATLPGAPAIGFIASVGP